METLSLQKEIPLNQTFDVIVAGGGPSGCAAAAAAAREGVKTLLIEGTGALGGMGTSGLVPAWCPFSDGEKIIYQGLAEKIFSAAKAGMPHISPDAADWVAIDPELLKRVYDDVVTGHGATVLFHTQVCAAEAENGLVSHIVTSNKSGLCAYKARVFIDCTGDADLAVWAGASYKKGYEGTGETQPATHCFTLSNVDEYAYRTGGKLHSDNKDSAIYDILRSGKFDLIQDAHCCNTLVGPGVVGFNAGHLWNVDGTDPFSTSEAMIAGRRLALQLQQGLGEFSPKAFANACLTNTANLMGIRETRIIEGAYCLSVDDYASKRTFADEIGRNCYYIDVHYTREEKRLAAEGKLDDKRRCAHYEKGESHGIPYGCLVPRGLKNLLVAGRSISCDRMVQGSVRVMPVCLVTGEAAGVAAAMAASAKQSTMEISVEALRNKLREYGAYLK